MLASTVQESYLLTSMTAEHKAMRVHNTGPAITTSIYTQSGTLSAGSPSLSLKSCRNQN